MKRSISLGILLLLPAPLAAQGILDEFSYEGLGFAGVGIEVGALASDRLQSEITGGMRIDYGFFAPRLRVVFGASYFKGDFDLDEILGFERSLRRVVVDPENNFTINVGSISWSNLQFDVDLLYDLARSGSNLLYAGAGLGLHLRNGAGPAIDGTFVEDALDTFAAGANVVLGGEVGLMATVSTFLDLRLGLTSELNTASARIGLMFRPTVTNNSTLASND